uniref:Reverse transcriptase domain-containing protein n=1 Tax=Callorhinchus milii TaxID=7868 RepID=A0A4W3H027_CALMI
MGSLCLLVLLDLSAAFDTVDHSILIHRLSALLNLHGPALAWFDSYLSHRLHFVASHGFSSSPQDSVLAFSSLISTSSADMGAPSLDLLFLIYVLPLGNVIRRHGVNFHMYADDTQIYFASSNIDSRSTNVLSACQADIRPWMSANVQQLNVDKTEPILFGSCQRLHSCISELLNLPGLSLRLMN